MFPDQSAPNLLQGLNPEQLSAVTWPPQSALVLAGAGSGKTRVLTTRIAWLLQTGQASVHSIMAVTFTNKAAKEMQTRLGAMIPVNVRAMWLGTFHGLCHRFLRLHHRDAGLPSSFQILDSGDQLSLIKRLLKSLNIAEEIIAPRSLQGFINAQKESGLRASVLSAPDPHTSRMIECYAEYDKICQREGVVDFAELMLRSYEMLQSNEILRQHYQNRFNHLLVDEFQDTNKLQYAWLKLMAEQGTFFTPTIGFLPTWYSTYPPDWTPELDAFPGETVVEKGLARTYENLRKAYELGITITIGSDSFSFVTPYGYVTIDEMYDFVDKVGVSILDTISAATYNGAKMLGKEDEFGAVKEGLSADLLVVKGDVASNIHDLTPENMAVIMKEGTIIIRGSF